jgi:hypothetical protein
MKIFGVFILSGFGLSLAQFNGIKNKPRHVVLHHVIKSECSELLDTHLD